MAVAITIRDVPDEVRDELAARAGKAGQSLQEYLRAHLADITARPTIDQVIDRARQRVQVAGTRVDPAATHRALHDDRR